MSRAATVRQEISGAASAGASAGSAALAGGWDSAVVLGAAKALALLVTDLPIIGSVASVLSGVCEAIDDAEVSQSSESDIFL